MKYIDVSENSLNDLISLRGRTAVVTGGAIGIGRAIGQRLAEAGASVVIGDLNAEQAQRTAEEFEAYGGKHIGARLDVNDHASVTALAQKAVDETGRLDIWVNNAGIYPSRKVLEIGDEEWARVLDINLRGTFFGAREAAFRMEPNKGVIINIVSTAAFNSSNGANPAHYVASKHAVAGLTKSLAVELGTRGIRTVGVAPTLTETPGVAAKREAGDEVTEALVQYAKGLPLGRLGVPDDIARVVLFAASDLGAFVTGTIIPVDGGDLAR
ncbi:Short-chain dehydrogenase/reductase, SDR family (plasmid) [Erwinia billingiae Eb661]|jgi:NAD(P)-dependent dehydrogenase (short-subunit alcohol dehydrogenase family)|uniref:Short-chain dehydrogenase/reductase, SDR family n=1 Tax=Erwinia billingiae (strain Eb661) TaxID=634500 RepID=D8MJC5_ERWBE|nr:SDR family NAD(P)-dependent oxidoreductase [Erwinia billingiae]CAX53309.1 Short-chain dehydrogenase/reductase, SDR family [Erwinia billingiae Eb661]